MNNSIINPKYIAATANRLDRLGLRKYRRRALRLYDCVIRTAEKTGVPMDVIIAAFEFSNELPMTFFRHFNTDEEYRNAMISATQTLSEYVK